MFFYLQDQQLTCILSHIGISSSLPTTAYVKMIDVWMIFTMTIPLLEIIGHAYSEYLRRQLAEGTSRTKLAAVAPYSQKSVLDKTKSADRR